MPGDPRPIGVFDSGMGGLTVLRALAAKLPRERFVYLGDTARLPYGTKSAETVRAYALQATHLLLSEGVKMVVIACNTASSVALGALQDALSPLPVIGVIEPGARAGVGATRNKRIAVLATEGTVRGGAYANAIRRLMSDAVVIQQPCQVFVALAEEGWAETRATAATVEDYLDPLFARADAPDTVVLGCTHFPVLAAAIQRHVGDGITLVDSAETTAGAVAGALAEKNLQATDDGEPRSIRFFATDSPERFARIGAIFLGRTIEEGDVTLVDLKMV
ncbi:glutamate racemase [Methyloceanibacter sp.]|uniref:glutamate racemase n=1 Tax=Methyloceanibacter sp. TaxID=1965321 RepID=UPI002C89D4A8|nr:glutamate racemase [Methyloceanibacter sp.]HML91264.1 glutamate racemase [Methyloceanibacter sp.]